MSEKAVAVPSSAGGRLQSLDVFRGVTIAGMILVNNPGSWDDAFPQLRHAAWNGWTATDLIFPFFLWIVGVSMVFSFEKRLRAGEASSMLLLHVAKRTAVLFALGIVVNGFPFGLLFDSTFSWATLRIPGVLQRIAVCYAAASLFLLGRTSFAVRGWTAAALLVGYGAAMMLIPVPGFGTGHLEPEGNLCWYIDSTLLRGHTWVFAPAEGFDPEGILSTIPAIATTLLGTMSGTALRGDRPHQVSIVWFFVAGYLLLLAGLIGDIWFPVNKNLWSSSYVLFTGGWACIFYACVAWLVDVGGRGSIFRPFTIFGMNAITVFVLSELLATLLWIVPGTNGAPTLHDLLYQWCFAPIGPPAVASLLFAVAFVAVLYGVAWIMWKKRWVIKV